MNVRTKIKGDSRIDERSRAATTMTDDNNGLRLTTKRIRSKGSHRSVDLNKQLKSSFKLSVVNAKKRQNKQKKSEETLKLALSILERCETALKPLDYDGLKASIAELDASYKSVITNPLFANLDAAHAVDAMHVVDAERANNDEEGETKAIVAASSKRRQARVAVKKTLGKSQSSFKKKLDRLTETIRIVESSKKVVDALRKQVAKDNEKTMNFKKQLCVEMKANFDPLFGGAIGYEHCSRTDPYGDNLSKSVWDSKTSKPS